MSVKSRIILAALVILGFFLLLKTEDILPSMEPSSGSAPTTSPLSAEAKDKTLSVNGTTIHIEVSDTDEKRTLGLGGRDSIADDEGMLFTFGTNGYHGIWMKGMKFSLDIIWLDDALKVVDMKENVAPETYPAEAFYPKESAYYVLEMKAGAAAKNGITVGSILRQK